MEPATLIFLGTQMELAGSQANLLAHARWFHQKGHKVTAVFFYDKQGLHEQWAAAHDFPIINLDTWKPGRNILLNLPMLMGGLFRLARLLRREQPQVVETFTPDSNLLGLPLAWLSGVPVRIATHRARIDRRPGWYARLHGLMINSGIATILIAVSEQVRQMALKEEKVQPDRVIVIPNGVELLPEDDHKADIVRQVRHELSLEADATLVLAVGRLTEQKGHSYLLQAIPDILAAHPGTVFAFAGEGPLHDSLMEQAKELTASESVRFLGLRRDVPRLLQAADIFVLPSLWEGMSMALLEAMGAGLPVVASKVEGTAELVSDGMDGLLVPPADPDALASAIIRLLGDKELRTRLGRTARGKIAHDFSIEAMCEKYKEVFWRMLRKTLE